MSVVATSSGGFSSMRAQSTARTRAGGGRAGSLSCWRIRGSHAARVRLAHHGRAAAALSASLTSPRHQEPPAWLHPQRLREAQADQPYPRHCPGLLWPRCGCGTGPLAGGGTAGDRYTTTQTRGQRRRQEGPAQQKLGSSASTVMHPLPSQPGAVLALRPCP